jgi:hypothetical protein
MWIDVRPFSGGKAVHFAGRQNEGGPDSPRWSPDSRQIAFLRFYCHSCNEKLFVKDFPSGSEKLLGEVCAAAPSWTPDGRFLIATELAGKNPGWDPTGRPDRRSSLHSPPREPGVSHRLSARVRRRPHTVKSSEDYKASYFLADIATSSVTPIAEDKVPKLPPVPLPEGSGQQHVAQGGRFLYYEAPVNWKPRLARVEGLVPR